MSEEWGPWIEHDGKGCPVKGMYVRAECDHDIYFCDPEVVMINKRTVEYIPTGDGRSWTWGDANYVRVLRYRVRRPKALHQLIQMVENLPAPSKQMESA